MPYLVKLFQKWIGHHYVSNSSFDCVVIGVIIAPLTQITASVTLNLASVTLSVVEM